MVVNREVAVERFVGRFADLSEYEEYLLVHLSAVSYAWPPLISGYLPTSRPRRI